MGDTESVKHLDLMEPASKQTIEQSYKPRGSARPRKRASKACLSCRARKVRCDVSQRGRPCMNCYLDSEACIVKERATKNYTASRDLRDTLEASHPPYPPIKNFKPASDPMNSKNGVVDKHKRPCLATEVAHGPGVSPATEKETASHQDGFQDTILNHAGGDDPIDIVEDDEPVPVEASQDNIPSHKIPESLEDCHQSKLHSHQYPEEQHTIPSDVIYCRYTFLIVSNIRNMPHQDINFLDLEGCFRVPVRSILDQFIEQYFLHVHPMMPLLNEGDFWDMYDSLSDTPPRNLSLLLFQAILFASCPFIPEKSMDSLGFTDMRTMRATFLRRTKLLYDFQTETCPLIISQATLLLTLATLSFSKTPNVPWLSRALEYAKRAEAHHYSTLSVYSEKELETRKRLWWCCIIQDRSIGLSFRRPIQITNEDFNFDTEPLDASDLDDETDRSKVYDRKTKRYLAQVVARWVRLCVILTDIVLLVFPPNDRQNPRNAQGHAINLHDCKAALRYWYTLTTLRLPKLPKNHHLTPASDSSLESDMRHPSVTLYTELIYLYYHMTRIIICHDDMFRFAAHNGISWNISGSIRTPIILEGRDELQDAISAITDCHKAFVRLRFTRWLPISVLGCIILPLVLSILDLGSSLPRDSCFHQTPNIEKQRANILVQVMETFWSQYDGVDWVAKVVRNAVSSARTWNEHSIPKWTDVMSFQPQLYLRLALAIDLSLSKGRLPQEADFPGYLVTSSWGRPCPVRRLTTTEFVDKLSNHPSYSENLVADVCAHETSSSVSCSTDTTYYPFGLDEAFIGNLEEQIHSCSANEFPDNGLAQFMDIGMKAKAVSHELQAQSSSEGPEDSVVKTGLFDTWLQHEADEGQDISTQGLGRENEPDLIETPRQLIE